MYELLMSQWGLAPWQLEEMTNSMFFRLCDALVKRLDPKAHRDRKEGAAFERAISDAAGKGGGVSMGNEYPAHLLKSNQLKDEGAVSGK